MTLRLLRTPAAAFLGAALLSLPLPAQSRLSTPASPYGGTTVEEIIARVNDQIITRADYDRAMKELDDEGRQHGESMQQLSEGHKDLLRNLIDQQLWISKGKELGINGETELINRLNDLRKQYKMESLEDLEKAATEQGVSFEDFKASIRNQIITQEVMRQEVGRHVSITPGEVQRYFDLHKQDYVQPESVRLSEILIATPTPAPAPSGGTQPDDPAKVAAAKAKADDVEAKLKAGEDFNTVARNSSDGSTAAAGGDLGQFKRGALAKVLEDATFSLKAGQFTEPIRTRQGYVILKVQQHVPGGVPEYKDVEQEVDQAYYETKVMPAMRDYLTKMREDSYVAIKDGYSDTGASTNARVQPISYATYTPPSPKKKKKVERTRFRETTHTFRQKSPQPAALPAAASDTAAAKPAAKQTKAERKAEQAAMKPGKKEKIRFGQAPTKTLPSAPGRPTEDAGAGAETQQAQNTEPVNPLEAAPVEKKSRFSDRAKAPKEPKAKGPNVDPMTPAAPDTGEVADRQTQSQALGLNGDTSKKKKKSSATTTGDKTRYSDRTKPENQQQEPQNSPAPTPIPPVPGAPAPQAPN